MPVYTQKATVPPASTGNRSTKVWVGGPDKEQETGQDYGYDARSRFGVIKVLPYSPAEHERASQCEVQVIGYQSRTVSNAKVPGSVIIDLPASVIISGPEGVNLLVESWEFLGVSDRGAADSYVVADTAVTSEIPEWAGSFDCSLIGDTASLSFFDALGNTVGALGVSISNFSVPKGAFTFTINGDAGSFVVFRQGL